MEEPEILLKRTPLSDRRGSLHTSISHCTRFSARASPCTHSSRKFSCCSKSQLLAFSTLRISLMMSQGSMELVVLILQVKRRERGLPSLISPFWSPGTWRLEQQGEERRVQSHTFRRFDLNKREPFFQPGCVFTNVDFWVKKHFYLFCLGISARTYLCFLLFYSFFGLVFCWLFAALLHSYIHPVVKQQQRLYSTDLSSRDRVLFLLTM